MAVGEIGLDYFVPGLDRDRQERFYHAQLQLAREHELPVLAARAALGRQAAQAPARRCAGPLAGIAHAFNGSAQQAEACIELGFKLGFGGAMTFERALQLRRLAATLPLDAIVLETDAPDIPPHWLYRTAGAARRRASRRAATSRASCRASPQSLAGLRGIALDALAEATTAKCRCGAAAAAALIDVSAAHAAARVGRVPDLRASACAGAVWVSSLRLRVFVA